MLSNHVKTIFCIVLAAAAVQAQYTPNPLSTRLGQEPPYLNPSVNDPLFFDNFNVQGLNNNSVAAAQRATAIGFLGSNIYYDKVRKIFINIVTGDYYDPSTGLIYRRTAVDRGYVNGRVGPNPMSTKHAPYEKSDAVELPKNYKRQIYGNEGDSDEDCHDCERKGQCYRCKRITPQHDCNSCYGGNVHGGCHKCYQSKMMANLPYQRMGELIIVIINRLRKENDLPKVTYNKQLYEIAMVQDLYMANRGYLNNDNFMANMSTFRGGNMTTGYLQELRLGDQDGAERFVSMWRKSPEHNENMMNADIDQCGAAVYFDQSSGRFIATLICVQL